MHSEELKWQIVDHSTHMLSSLNQAEELNHAIAIMMEGYAKNAQMRENQGSNNTPLKSGFFIPNIHSHSP
ncbi:hypothetical protein Pcaca05_41990 [Pectobacterium carotovorum subsp. carotovorum]|nr:hypothetical protein Pcaca05_41990 [Pectobacterium carotovorum subsp. carotovorum]